MSTKTKRELKEVLERLGEKDLIQETLLWI
jgi:hypothetical protein